MISTESAAIRARALLASRGQDTSNLRNPRVLALISDALELTANRVAQSDDYEGLQKDFAVTPVAGVVDLTALTTTIFDIARSTVRVASSNLPLTPLDSIFSLTNNPGLSADQVYYALDGTDLRFRDTAGSVVSYVIPVKIRANFIPTLATLPFRYENLFISTLAELLTRVSEAKRA